jgi:hypothetical protein
MDYEKYSEKAMRRKPTKDMDDLERDYYEMTAQKEATKIIENLQDSPQFLHSVAMKVAEHALKNKQYKEGTI